MYSSHTNPDLYGRYYLKQYDEAYMESDFYWTAKLYIDDRLAKTMYFSTEMARNQFVLSHPGWKKHGKICAENLDRHLSHEDSSFYEPER